MFVPVTTQSAADLAEAWNHTCGWSVVSALMCLEQAIAAAQVLGNQVNAQYWMVAGGRARARGPGVHSHALNDERIDPLIRRSVLLMLAR